MMSDRSKIEWTDATWNPVTGCSWASPGCDHCYANRMAHRLQAMGKKKYQQGFAVTVHRNSLGEPLNWCKPRRVFVCSMGDLFHDAVPVDFLNRIFATMRAAAWNRYIILTKRPHRLRDLINTGSINWPWNLVCLGVTVESRDYEGRIQTILPIPALIHFVSIEPCLGLVDVSGFLRPRICSQCGRSWADRACGPTHALLAARGGLDWVVLGGETGPGARPMHPVWARGPRDQCIANGIPFFFKGWGEWAVAESPPGLPFGGPSALHRVGKKKTGRLLDGREWNQMPENHGG